MRTVTLKYLFTLLTILTLLAGVLPVSAQSSGIVIDGIKEAAWGTPLAVDPKGDMTEANLDVDELYVTEDASNYFIGFNAFASSWGMTYGIYIDTDQVDGSGAPSDPWGRTVGAVTMHLPEHVLYVWHDGGDWLQDVQLNHWNGSGWSYDSLVIQGGEQAYGADNDWIEYRVPKAALGNPSRIALELFTTGGSGHAQDSVPSDPNVSYASPDWGDSVTTLSAFVTYPQTVTWYIRGSFNGWGTSDLVYDDGTHGDTAAGDGIYTTQLTLAAGRYEFKVAVADWSVGYPSSNAWFHTDGSPVTIQFDTNTYPDGWLPSTNLVKVSTEPGTWTAVGDWQGWNNANPATAMTALSGGVYQLVTTIPSPGTYMIKAVATGTWDAIGSDGRGIDAPNAFFTTVEANQEVTFQIDAVAGRLRVDVTPVPPRPNIDNNIWWDGLGHNSRDTLYRIPQGAVTTGTPVTLRFRTYENDLTEVILRVWSTTAGAQSLIPMQKVAVTEDTPFPYQYWQADIPAQTSPTILYYRFIVRDGTDEDYYEDDDLFDGAWGRTYDDSQDYSWQIDVYQPDYTTPDWMKNAVIYQIYPDRFFNGIPGNDAKPSDPSVYGNPVVKKAWTDLPEGYCRAYQGAGVTCSEAALGRDFFGGDLVGVMRKLDYLKSLGVTAIYFNPVFQAPSNHLYDTTNYLRIDPYFGNNLQWLMLVNQAEKKGIRIILDGVFNHTSSDSLYFDKYSRYPSVGAYESQISKYFDWYTFTNWPGTYNSWWGFDTLPVLTEVQGVKDFIYAKPNSVAPTWIKLGASGWRLDVAPDKSHVWWQEFRPQVKKANPNAVIIGEIWDDASPWLLGNEFDSTMNYRFRRALLGFLNGDSSDPNQGVIRGLNPSQFDSTLQSIREDYPKPAFDALMNLVGSHDTQRILWALTPGERNRNDKEFNAANVAEGKSKLKLLTILQMTLPGAPTVYYGDEVGLSGDTDPDDRRPFPWNNMDTALLNHYKKLISIRKSATFLRTGSLDTLYTDDANQTYAFGRKDASGAAVVAVNNSTTARELVIPVQGYVPNGTLLKDMLNGTTAAVSDGQVTVQVAGRWGAILVTPKGTDLTPPSAPTGLAAVSGDTKVDLAWNTVSGASGYNVYRSPVTGGGYVRLNGAPLSSTGYTDTAVVNGRVYYYVVTALDAAGNESKFSDEVEGLPQLVIGWANLQWPPTITHIISAVNATDNIYGQVWIDGKTVQPGPTVGLASQVGYGPRDSIPDGNSDWMWVDAAFNVDSGNNDEFVARLLPEAVGEYDYAYRYTTTGGRSWIYADLDGIGNGYSTAQAGKMTVQPSGDTTAPAAPANLRIDASSNSFITLDWDASVDSDVYRYDIYRADGAGGPYVYLGSTTGLEYIDNSVAANQTYFYVVAAVDSSFNRSGFSAEVAATATPRQVSITFNVAVPDWTPVGDTVYIAGSMQNWDPSSTPLTQVDATHWTITMTLPENTRAEYKYTRGSWDYVEKGPSCEEIANRIVQISYGTTGSQTVNDTVVNWRNTGTCGN